MKKIPMRKAKPSVPYTPRFSGAFEGLVYNYVKEMYPKLRFKGLEFDDLLQEAVVVFLVCREKYAGKVDNPAWFMSLFRRALSWRFIDLQRNNFPYISFDEADGIEEPVTERDVGFCWRMLQELPGDMKELLTALGLGDDSVLPALRSRVAEMAAETQPLVTKET